METFFYSFSDFYQRREFTTTFNGTYFTWKLVSELPYLADGHDFYTYYLKLHLQDTDAVVKPCLNDVKFLFKPVEKKNTTRYMMVSQRVARYNRYNPSCYNEVDYWYIKENFREFPDGDQKFFVKICIPRKYFENSRQPAKLVDRLIMPAKMADDLFDQVIGVTETDKLSDVIFTSSDGRKYFCHKFVLSASSDVFKTMFGRFECDKEINIKDVDGETMETVLRYVYKNEFDDMKVKSPMAEKILYAAEKYNLLELKWKCEARFKFYLDHSNALYYLELAEKYSLKSLGSACLKIVELFDHLMEEEDVAVASSVVEMFKRLNIAGDV